MAVATAWTIKAARPVLRLKHQVGSRLPVQTLRVAMAYRPDLRPRILLTVKWIVLRNCAIVIQSERLAGKRVELLRKIAPRRITGGYIELSIRPKTNATAGVKLCRGNVFNYHFPIDEPLSSFAKTKHANAYSIPTRIRIREINETITAELWM